MKHSLFVLALLALSSACPVHAEEAPPTQWEKGMLDQAATCTSEKVSDETRSMLLKMLRIEQEESLPDHVRGITVAIACIEAKFNPKAEGDHKFSKDGKTPMAIGLFQMWPFWKKYKVDRKDPYAATKVWLTFLKGQTSYVERTCKPKTEERKWSAAVAYSMMGPGKRCGQTTNHQRLLQKWQKAIAASAPAPARIGQK